MPIRALAKDLKEAGRFYLLWLFVLLVVACVGVAAYGYQLSHGLIVTNMTNHVSWGIYIANFTFLVGLAAAAVMVVIPAYAYKHPDFKHIVFVGELLAVCAVLMCLLFVTVDLGRPDRSWHLIPFLGRLNFPVSVLAWDVVVLQGYLILNLGLVGTALWAKFTGRKPSKAHVPLVFVSMVWAVSIHTVTAFLYSWLGARPFWNSAIVAPRFIASAFVSGPAFLIVTLGILQRSKIYPIKEIVFTRLRQMVAVALLINMFLFLSEIFVELYGGSLHSAPMRQLLFGHEGHYLLPAWVWTAMVLEWIAVAIFVTPRFSSKQRLVEVACVFSFIGVWIEKGMALIVPGFVPTVLGEYATYTPSLVETLVSLGIWAFGLFVFTLLLRLGIRIESGALIHPDRRRAGESA